MLPPGEMKKRVRNLLLKQHRKRAYLFTFQVYSMNVHKECSVRSKRMSCIPMPMCWPSQVKYDFALPVSEKVSIAMQLLRGSFDVECDLRNRFLLCLVLVDVSCSNG